MLLDKLAEMSTSCFVKLLLFCLIWLNRRLVKNILLFIRVYFNIISFLQQRVY